MNHFSLPPSEPVFLCFRISTGRPMWCTRPTMSAGAREARWWEPEVASEAVPSGSPVNLSRLLWCPPWCGLLLLLHTRTTSSYVFSRSPTRFVRCWEDNHQFCSWRVSGVPCYPLLLVGWRQHSPWPEQESGLLLRGPRGKHPSRRRGGETFCRCRACLHHQFHLSLRQGHRTVCFHVMVHTQLKVYLIEVCVLLFFFTTGSCGGEEDPCERWAAIFWGVRPRSSGGVWEQRCQRTLQEGSCWRD